jgi:hypothetical protein
LHRIVQKKRSTCLPTSHIDKTPVQDHTPPGYCQNQNIHLIQVYHLLKNYGIHLFNDQMNYKETIEKSIPFFKKLLYDDEMKDI